MFYCINNNVIFDPLKHTLTSSKFYPEKDTKLNQPTSRCLSLLIERKGCVITQEDFMNEVWRKHGMEVTVNTLYQNISILRKTLKRVGIDENIIITVPKKGITLSAQVEKLSDKTFLPSSPPLPLTQQEESLLNRKGSLSQFLVLWLLLLVTLFALWLAFN
ncbi:winged helix-turn-helix domain-containing protein [Mixta hanseatica]|uniref:Winged helix-turn-helix domain-containing protein n=1 Tax=Mixta hanseatica TaxID=2872648 RepID=A0ABY4R962_9GAMM|nr:winged helix-turn-helix domain-containing protein [Mixta hanseatica]UQY44654.1 winged helix-turn-helix domain-containing protein [Mixta hanseatica]